MALWKSWLYAGQLLQQNKRLRWDYLGLALLFFSPKLLAVLTLFNLGLPRLIQFPLLLSAEFFWHIFLWHTLHRTLCQAELVPLRKKFFFPILWVFFWNIFLLQIVPLALFGAHCMIQEAAHHSESAPWLFSALHLTMLAVLGFFFWLYWGIGMWCAPFVWMTQDCPSWKVPFRAMKMAYGIRRQLLSMMLCYSIAALPLITLPRAGISAVVLLGIRAKQAEERQA